LKNLSNLERRVEALEIHMAGLDPLEFAIDSLRDNEIGLLSEYRELHLAGFTAEEVRGMMGSESYDLAIAVMQSVDSEIVRLTMPPSRKLVAKKKMRAAIDGGIGGSVRKSKSDDVVIDYDEE
jgi:hypothetical protein